MDDADTAVNCINAAKGEIELGNFERAITFLERAQRLHSPFAKENSEASKLIRQCNIRLKDPSVNKNSSSSKKQEESEFERAKRESFGSAPKNNNNTKRQQEAPTSPSSQSSGNSEPSTPSSPSNEPKEGVDFTKEDADACKAILKLKDYYQILGIQKSASEDEIKKAYKKLAVKFHPDRNKAPQASDAFKSVSAAYMCLSNPEKKRMYDQYGTEDLASRMGSGAGHHFQGGFYGPDHMSEEDIFNIFAQMFGGHEFMSQRQRRGRGGHQQQRFRFQQFHDDDDNDNRQQQRRGGRQQQQGFNLGVLFQLLPLLLIVVFSLFAQFSSMGTSHQEEEIFSFVKTPSYSVSKSSQYGGIKYYVKPEFERQYSRYPHVIQQVDSRVYSKYRSHLTEECRLEKKRRDQLSKQVANEKDENKREVLKKKLDGMVLNKCDEFQKIYGGF